MSERLKRWIQQKLCSHQFRGVDLGPRNFEGLVSWPCAKCGRVYQEPYGILMGNHGEITGPWGIEPARGELKDAAK